VPTLVHCPECSRKLRIPDDLLGKKVKCPDCQGTFTAEAEDAPAEKPAVDEGVEEKPSSRRKRSAPPAEEEERPKRRRGRDDEDDDEEDRPSRRRPRRFEDDEDDDEEDEDDRPSKRRRRRFDDDEDDDDDDYRRSRVRRDLEPHRGTLILVLGILSTCLGAFGMCCFGVLLGPVALGLGIPAWVMGHGDRKRMAAGTLDPSGRGPTTGGYVCGIVGTCLGALALLLSIAAIIFQFSVLNKGKF
jgi:predicted Zn finger-like uncharacterized protein